MNRRTKKKVHNREVDERLDALEELTRRMAAEQTAHRERVDEVEDSLIEYQEAVIRATRKANERRIHREHIRQERERERRHNHRELAKCFAVLAVAIAFLLFALMLPTPAVAKQGVTAEPVAAVAVPAEGVVEAVSAILEG